MKEWKKPFVKVVIIEEVLVCSCSPSYDAETGVQGEGAKQGRGIKWENQN